MTETVGLQLLNARLSRGESIDQAAQATHIRPRFLQALEMDDWAALPSTVQGKGFLRLYAGYLNLDAQPLLAALASPQAVPDPAPVAFAEPSAPGGAPPILPAPPEPELLVEDAPDSEEPSPAGPDGPLLSPGMQPSQELFIEIGQTLKQQRELISLSLGEVERHTHLRSATLALLEAGRMEELPSFVQARGMLANYAHFLNLDGDKLLLRFAEALQARREEKAAAELRTQQASARRPAPKVVANLPLRRLFSVDVLATAGLIVLLVAVLIWVSGQVLSQRANLGVTATSPSISDVLLATPQPSQASLAAVAPQQTPSQPAGTTPDAAAEPTAAQIPAGLPAGTPGAIEVNLIASQRPWIKVTADNKMVFSGRLVPGNAYPFSAGSQIEILTGNAAGFQVYLNNQDQGVPGTEGQVLDLIFTSKGMQKLTLVIPTSPATATPALPAATGTPAAGPTATKTAPASATPAG